MIQDHLLDTIISQWLSFPATCRPLCQGARQADSRQSQPPI